MKMIQPFVCVNIFSFFLKLKSLSIYNKNNINKLCGLLCKHFNSSSQSYLHR